MKHLAGRIPEKILKGLRHPAVIATAISFGVRVGREAYRLRTKDIDYDEFKRRTVNYLGEIGGTSVGAALGAAAGSFVPGVGAVFGAFAGAMVGELAGEHAARTGAEGVHRIFEKKSDESEDSEAAERLRHKKRHL